MIINLIYDAAAMAAPQSFRDGMQQAANELEAAFTDNITINIAVGYGEFGGQPINPNTAEANIGYTGNNTNGLGIDESYSTLRSQLIAHATTADDQTSVANLPNTSSLDGQSTFTISTAQAKAFGLISGTNTAVDGQVGMGTNFTG